MWYAITWLTEAVKDRQQNRTFVTDFKFVANEINWQAMNGAYDFQIEETSCEKEFGLTPEILADMQAILDEPVDTDPIIDWVQQMESKQRADEHQWWAERYARIFEEARQRAFRHSLEPVGFKRTVSIEAQKELAQLNIQHAIHQLMNGRENELIYIALPNDEAITLRQFHGTRENGYMIGHVFIEVAYKNKRIIKSYYTIRTWLEKMQNMPISSLASLSI